MQVALGHPVLGVCKGGPGTGRMLVAIGDVPLPSRFHLHHALPPAGHAENPSVLRCQVGINLGLS